MKSIIALTFAVLVSQTGAVLLQKSVKSDEDPAAAAAYHASQNYGAIKKLSICNMQNNTNCVIRSEQKSKAT